MLERVLNRLGIYRWLVYYEGGKVVQGWTRWNWIYGPHAGVQVVVRMRPPDRVRWSCDGVPIRDRELWTGDDEYDPFGWGIKIGTLIPDEEYWAIWRRACGTDSA